MQGSQGLEEQSKQVVALIISSQPGSGRVIRRLATLSPPLGHTLSSRTKVPGAALTQETSDWVAARQR